MKKKRNCIWNWLSLKLYISNWISCKSSASISLIHYFFSWSKIGGKYYKALSYFNPNELKVRKGFVSGFIRILCHNSYCFASMGGSKTLNWNSCPHPENLLMLCTNPFNKICIVIFNCFYSLIQLHPATDSRDLSYLDRSKVKEKSGKKLSGPF